MDMVDDILRKKGKIDTLGRPPPTNDDTRTKTIAQSQSSSGKIQITDPFHPHMNHQPLRSSTKNNAENPIKLVRPRISPRSISPFDYKSPANFEKDSLEETTAVADVSDKPSLFDIFQAPNDNNNATKKHVQTSPNAFETEAFAAYKELLEHVLRRDHIVGDFRKMKTSKPIPNALAKEVIAWWRSEEPVVSYNLPTLDKMLSSGVDATKSVSDDTNLTGTTSFMDQVKTQRERFLQEMQWNDVQHDMLQRGLYYLVNECARNAKGLPVPIIWEKVKEAGIVDEKMLHTLLYVSSTFSPGNRRKSVRYGKLTGTSILDILETATASVKGDAEGLDDKDDDNNMVDQTDEIAVFHDLCFSPTEQSINVRMRLLVAQGKVKEAEDLLLQHEETVVMRLRAYTPILRLYLEEKDVSSALRIFRRMVDTPSVHLDADAFITLLTGLAENGCFHPLAPKIDSVKEYGYAAESGPGLFDDIAEEMSRTILEIPAISTKRLYNAFAEGFPDSGLEKTSSLLPIQVNNEPAGKNELILNRVVVDQSSGECVRSGVKLRLISLDGTQREKLKDAILSMARPSQVDLRKKSKKLKKTCADEALLSFYNWLDEREGEPFTAIIDGANIGYYLQNFEQGRFSFHQIQFVVDTLEKIGERPLVILPNKYTRDQFYTTIGAGASSSSGVQVVTPEEVSIRSTLLEEGKMFVVPRGFLDDYYWILASVSEQRVSRNGKDISVPVDNPEGRWPGTRPILISNDQMRDHKLEMLEPMLFRRWFSNYIVNYNFSGFVGPDCDQPEIGFTPVDFFSREIQGNKSNDGMVWHFPIADTLDEWLCVRIPPVDSN